MGTISHLGRARLVLESAVFQYLGRISYSLYLVHGPVLWLVGDYVYGLTRDFSSVMWPLGLTPGFLLAQTVLLSGTLCVADIATLLLDTQSIKMARVIYRWMECL